ncbi:MAG: FtsB family cell division protein [Galactobacter sp.]
MSDKAPRVPYRGKRTPPVVRTSGTDPEVPDDQASAPTAAEPAARAATASASRAPASGEPEAATASIPVVRPKKKHPSVADGARRLRERMALEGAIHDPGDDARPAPAVPPEVPDRPTPARALSTRVITLSLILIISGFTLFPTTTTYLRQQGELRAAQAKLAEETATKERLDDELKRWDDPEYVKQQARERIGMAVPGEKQYVNVGEPKGTQRATSVEPGEYRQGLPWGDGLWDSVMRASNP